MKEGQEEGRMNNTPKNHPKSKNEQKCNNNIDKASHLHSLPPEPHCAKHEET